VPSRRVTHSVGFLLEDSARLFRRAFGARNRETTITALQYRVLAYVARRPGMGQRAMADLIEVEPITLSRMVDRLAAAGLAERRPDAADRRAWRLYLTRRGARHLRAARTISLAVGEIATEGMSEADRALLVQLVEHVRSNLSRRTGD